MEYLARHKPVLLPQLMEASAQFQEQLRKVSKEVRGFNIGTILEYKGVQMFTFENILRKFMIFILELSDHDDIATAAIIDPYLGFQTHKMNMRFRNPKAANQRQLKKVVEKFIDHQSYERAYKELIGTSDWLAATLTARKSKLWQAGLREHVSIPN